MELPLIGNLFLWGLQPFRLTRLVRKTAEPFKKKKKKKEREKDIFTLMQLSRLTQDKLQRIMLRFLLN